MWQKRVRGSRHRLSSQTTAVSVVSREDWQTRSRCKASYTAAGCMFVLVLPCYYFMHGLYQEHLKSTHCEDACSAGCGVQLLRKEVSWTLQVHVNITHINSTEVTRGTRNVISSNEDTSAGDKLFAWKRSTCHFCVSMDSTASNCCHWWNIARARKQPIPWQWWTCHWKIRIVHLPCVWFSRLVLCQTVITLCQTYPVIKFCTECDAWILIPM